MARLILAAAVLLTGCHPCTHVCEIRAADAAPALSEDTPSGRDELKRLRRYNGGGDPLPPEMVKSYCEPKWTEVLDKHCAVVVNELCDHKCKDSESTEQCKKEERDIFVHSCAERSVGPFKQALTKCASATGIDARNGLLFQ